MSTGVGAGEGCVEGHTGGEGVVRECGRKV